MNGVKDMPCSREWLYPAPKTGPGVPQLTLADQLTSEECAYQITYTTLYLQIMFKGAK